MHACAEQPLISTAPRLCVCVCACVRVRAFHGQQRSGKQRLALRRRCCSCCGGLACPARVCVRQPHCSSLRVTRLPNSLHVLQRRLPRATRQLASRGRRADARCHPLAVRMCVCVCASRRMLLFLSCHRAMRLSHCRSGQAAGLAHHPPLPRAPWFHQRDRRGSPCGPPVPRVLLVW
jgi:hypothetical protein